MRKCVQPRGSSQAMQKTIALAALAALCSSTAFAQVNIANIVDLELLTHTELSQKLPADRTLEIRDTPEFTEIAHRVRMALHEGHG